LLEILSFEFLRLSFFLSLLERPWPDNRFSDFSLFSYLIRPSEVLIDETDVDDSDPSVVLFPSFVIDFVNFFLSFFFQFAPKVFFQSSQNHS